MLIEELELELVAKAIASHKRRNEPALKTGVIRLMSHLLNGGYGRQYFRKRFNSHNDQLIESSYIARKIFDRCVDKGFIEYIPCKPLVIKARTLDDMVQKILDKTSYRAQPVTPIKKLVFGIQE